MQQTDSQAEVYYFAEDIDYCLTDEERYTRWILQIALQQHKQLAGINYIFCSDEYLLNINKEHLDHDYYTDIITFPIQDEPIISDIFISIDRVKDNANTLNIAFDDELRRVMAHGILHLCGYGDKSAEEAQIMRSKEDDSMRMFAEM